MGGHVVLTIDHWDALHRDSPVTAPGTSRTADCASSGLVARGTQSSLTWTGCCHWLGTAAPRRSYCGARRAPGRARSSRLPSPGLTISGSSSYGRQGQEGEVLAHWPRPIVELSSRHRTDGPDRDQAIRSANSDALAELTNECAEALRSMIGRHALSLSPWTTVTCCPRGCPPLWLGP